MTVNEFFESMPIELVYSDENIFEMVNSNGDVITIRPFRGFLYVNIVENTDEEDKNDFAWLD